MVRFDHIIIQKIFKFTITPSGLRWRFHPHVTSSKISTVCEFHGHSCDLIHCFSSSLAQANNAQSSQSHSPQKNCDKQQQTDDVGQANCLKSLLRMCFQAVKMTVMSASKASKVYWCHIGTERTGARSNKQ